MSKRDTYKYELTQGNKVVYVGITNDPARREMEHSQDKNFDKMRIVGSASTLDSASQWDTKLHITMRNNKYKTRVFIYHICQSACNVLRYRRLMVDR